MHFVIWTSYENGIISLLHLCALWVRQHQLLCCHCCLCCFCFPRFGKLLAVSSTILEEELVCGGNSFPDLCCWCGFVVSVVGLVTAFCLSGRLNTVGLKWSGLILQYTAWFIVVGHIFSHSDHKATEVTVNISQELFLIISKIWQNVISIGHIVYLVPTLQADAKCDYKKHVSAFGHIY